MAVQQQTSRFHPLPVVGHPDAFYVKQIEQATKAGDSHALESAKVGRYVTLAMDANMPWEEKLRHYLHALKRHCIAPPGSPAEVVSFYQRLAELVRKHASQEAVRFVAHQTESQHLRGKTADQAGFAHQASELRQRLFGENPYASPHWMTQEAFERINRLLGKVG